MNSLPTVKGDHPGLGFSSFGQEPRRIGSKYPQILSFRPFYEIQDNGIEDTVEILREYSIIATYLARFPQRDEPRDAKHSLFIPRKKESTVGTERNI
jgi:hypothetical protein